MIEKKFETEIGGAKLSATFSDLVDQASGAVMMQLGETVVLVTAVMSKDRREGIDFFPLVVDYEEKFYAAGRILGSRFMKREGKPSDEAVLTGRMIDRTIRPMFDQRMRNEVQVVATVLSLDDKNDPSVPAIIGASLALSISDIPWAGPASAIRIALAKDQTEYLVNPANGETANLRLDTLVCGQDGKINMIEAKAQEVNEEELGLALAKAVAEIAKLEVWQKGIISEIGKEKTRVDLPETPAKVKELFDQHLNPVLAEYVFAGLPGKGKMSELTTKWVEILKAETDDLVEPGLRFLDEKIDEALHTEAINNNRRADGRQMTELRPIYAKAGGLTEIVHGTGIFYRGGTHILSVLTLAGPKDSQIIEGMEVQGKKHFMHHYNFPPFSTGETGRLGGMNRRAIGHGALAEKSLEAVLPPRAVFPYTIRLVSEAMASNGSTSMGSVCASTLALMDGGVPITRPVAGIAMGLMYESAEKYKILTDIQGPEDHHGDMDFKVAGTTAGITGIQLDIKMAGIPPKILTEALVGAKVARLQIIEKIILAIPTPRATLKPTAPQIEMLTIPVGKIGAVIGPGGKMIQKISADTGAEIEIEDDGSVFVTGRGDGAKRARQIIEEITHEYKVGERFTGIVTRLMDFGAFVKIGRDTEGLVHISELADFRVNKVSDIVQVGAEVPVVIKEIDDQHRVNLSIKRADPNFGHEHKPVIETNPSPETKSEN
ncbi:MAG: polyribonucleotide nucleotidyltransferase [Candidatus Vogelbacteria bacterium RIFOXYD1_FULL_44_32]|uniref:Polyribonucleotide nucleotidyltransferase n=1 Tax=Candidatus Vogelbacteria bacterium RIFOXYD1_FULL_44_32 TaxID=1802438 RepID=A0A1G2QE78_9BACT|nr:MAG: polyribonucleotide nucleotidyltransferase [Candidatus Vogelbacteria bacterium RIFOXYD1_FULL_44_32]